MTTTPFTEIDLDILITTIATINDAASELDLDCSSNLDLFIAAAHALRASTRTNDSYLLLAAFDLCPMHEYDAEICADDDDASCLQLRIECDLA